ncbi:MAG: RecX family transcriptional regulator [Bacteroidota bacterium]
MIITKIERQKKNKSRFSIFVDGKYAFSVGEDVYVRFVLHTGQELSPTERDEIENAELESSVKKTALRYRSYRPRSTKEVYEYLTKKGYDERNIESALAYLKENNLLNDEEFARMVCRDRLTLKPVGKTAMKQILLKKGIDRTTIDEVLQKLYTADKESTLALKEAERKYKRIASLPPLAKKKKIYEHLLRRGYESSLSLKIANQMVKS